MIRAELYSTVYLYSVILLTLIVAFKMAPKSYAGICRDRNDSVLAFGIALVYALWIGLRPESPVFGDSYYYTHTFNMMQKYHLFISTVKTDWVWNSITVFCTTVTTLSGYYTIIALGYFLFSFLSCRILFRQNTVVGLLFLMGSFSFYSYSCNGIRNGLACSLVLVIVAMACASRKKKDLLWLLLLSYLAFNIHRSTILPIIALFMAKYLVKSFKAAYTFWLLSILISLFAGGYISTFLAGLGFDDRLSYITNASDGHYTKVGFRWDFLIYSMMPIVLGYYVVIKRGIRDKSYELLLNTYTLANAVWVMIIRANYSNRFAYLSWFMYPVVLAYPLLKLDVWGEKQGRMLCNIMLLQVAFTWFMQTIY